MRHALLALTVAAVALPSFAGQNPDIRIYLDADPPNHVHEVSPDTMTTFNVYVCLDCLGEGSGLRAVIFKFHRTFGGYLTTKVALMGGGHLGDPENETYGWTISAGEDCVYPDENGIVVAGYVIYLYVGPPGTLDLVRVVPGWEDTCDCNFDEDFFCIHANLGVWMPPNPGESCECHVTPAEAPSWGAIKALYR